MTLKTRRILIGILIGVLPTISCIVLIAVLTLHWNVKDFHTSNIPIYPNSNNAVQSFRNKIPSNVFIGTGTLFDQLTTFQTSDTVNDVLTYYQTAYPQEYKCSVQEVNSTVTDSSFICVESSHDSTTTYSVKITTSSTSSSVNTISVSEVLWIQQVNDL